VCVGVGVATVGFITPY